MLALFLVTWNLLLILFTRSKLAAAVAGGISEIYIKPGSKVLYLGAASGTTVSHVADIVGPVSVSESDLDLEFDLTFGSSLGRHCLRR